MSYIRITPEPVDDPSKVHRMMNDLIEFVDDDGKATDISCGIQGWAIDAKVGEVRRVTFTTLQVVFG